MGSEERHNLSQQVPCRAPAEDIWDEKEAVWDTLVSGAQAHMWFVQVSSIFWTVVVVKTPGTTIHKFLFASSHNLNYWQETGSVQWWNSEVRSILWLSDKLVRWQVLIGDLCVTESRLARLSQRLQWNTARLDSERKESSWRLKHCHNHSTSAWSLLYAGDTDCIFSAIVLLKCQICTAYYITLQRVI